MREPVIWTDGKVVELQMIQLLSDVKHNLSLLIAYPLRGDPYRNDSDNGFKHRTWSYRNPTN